MVAARPRRRVWLLYTIQIRDGSRRCARGWNLLQHSGTPEETVGRLGGKHGEGKEADSTSRVDCARREGIEEALEKQDSGERHCQGDEAHAWRCKAKGNEFGNLNRSPTMRWREQVRLGSCPLLALSGSHKHPRDCPL